MARGWESKSVEAQIEGAEADRASAKRPVMTAEQIESARKKNGLLLGRARLLQDLETCRHPRYRDILTQALAELEAQLAEFD
jgi:hypothetical protein